MTASTAPTTHKGIVLLQSTAVDSCTSISVYFWWKKDKWSSQLVAVLSYTCIIYQITIIFIEHAFDTAETPHEAFTMLGIAQMTKNEVQESSTMQRDAVVVNHQEFEGTGTSIDKILVYLNFVSPILSFLKKNGIMWLLKYIITTMINCQQSLVLLPLIFKRVFLLGAFVQSPLNFFKHVCSIFLGRAYRRRGCSRCVQSASCL